MKSSGKQLKKSFKVLLSVIVLILFVGILTGCGKKETKVVSNDITWIVEETAPTSSTSGSKGTMYLDTSKYDIYQKTSNGWVLVGNIAGKDGLTPTISINDDGYWIINDVNTNLKATFDNKDIKVPEIKIDKDGYWTIDGKTTNVKAVGKDGVNGTNGADGKTPVITVSEDGYWIIDGTKTSYKAIGKDGTDGTTPTLEIDENGYWIINGTTTSYKAVGIDGANGKDGVDGKTPVIKINEEGYWVINDEVTSVRAEGVAGLTPTISINEEGYWVINEVATTTKAEAINGTNGKDGSIWYVGVELPSTGNVKDMFLHKVTFDIYQYDGASWVLTGNIKGTNSINLSNTNYVHISFDDVEISFINLTNKNYNSLYEEPFFKYLKELHDTYGAKFSLYSYNNVLANVPSTYAEEFREASDWLKIGLHATNSSSTFETSTYDQGKSAWNTFVANIIRITGSYLSVDRMPRLHYFAGTEEALKGMRDANYGAIGFISSDGIRDAYYFSGDRTNYLYNYDHITDYKNGLVFVSTDIRLDWFDGTTSAYTYHVPSKSTVYDELEYRYTTATFANSISSYIVFGHEWKFYNGSNLTAKGKEYLVDICRFVADNKLHFDFPQNKSYNSTPYDIYPTIQSGSTTTPDSGSGGDTTDPGSGGTTTPETPSGETTTYGDGTILTIVNKLSDLSFKAHWSANGGASTFKQDANNGRAITRDYVLKVNGGEKIAINPSATIGINFAIDEYKDKPLSASSHNANGESYLRWISDEVTLQSDTKYIIIGIKRTDGVTSWSTDELDAIKTSLIITSTGTEETEPETPNETTAEFGGVTIPIITSFDDSVWAIGKSVLGTTSNHEYSNTVGRVAGQFVLKVNGGETISITQNISGVSLAYSLKEYKELPFNNTNANGNGQQATVWLTSDTTLHTDTRYVIIAIKRGDGSTNFTTSEVELLKSSLTIK